MRYLLMILLTVYFLNSAAQDRQHIKSLTDKINHAANDAQKIALLSELAEYYTVYNLGNKGDSLLQKALMIAEFSDDRSAIMRLLINNSVTGLTSRSNQKTFEKGVTIIQNGLRYAQDIQDSRLEALAYIRLASIHRKKHLLDDALQYTARAVTALADTKDADSVKIELFLELGDIYRAKSEPVPACKNYNNAFEIAYRQKNSLSESDIYHRFSGLYRSFHDDETAKDYLLESLRLNVANNNTQGVVADYLGLAKITNEREYIEKAATLAEKMKSAKYIMQARLLMYYWYMVVGKNSTETFNFLDANPGIVQYFLNANRSGYVWEKGSIYKYGGNYDSALTYFRAAEADMIAANNPGILIDTYNTIGETYLQNGDTANARKYLEKAFIEAKRLNRLPVIVSVGGLLGELAAKNSNYANAYYYAIRADSANKLVLENAAKDKIALLGIDRENKKREADRLELANKTSRKHNLQIMAITVLITAFFGLLLFIGMFEVSKTTIRVLGYFGFISLFEFIILVLDHPIIEFTHGEPLRIWGIKILLIGMLVPIQHYLERRLITYLESRELVKARKGFSIKNWWRPKQVSPSPGNDIAA